MHEKSVFPTHFEPKASALLKKFKKIRLMVAGDLMVDEAVYGDSERISREAPVLILRYTHTDLTPAGRPTPPITPRTWGPRFSRWEWSGRMSRATNFSTISK